MQTHTIRNKGKPTPIVTLTAPFMAKMLAARPESASLVLSRFLAEYARLTGKRAILSHDQNQALLARTGANAKGHWTSPYLGMPSALYLVRSCFVSGFMGAGSDFDGMDEALLVAEAFFDGLDAQLEAVRQSSPVG